MGWLGPLNALGPVQLMVLIKALFHLCCPNAWADRSHVKFIVKTDGTRVDMAQHLARRIANDQ